MSLSGVLLGTLLKPPGAWNQPRWRRYLVPLGGAASALAAAALADGLGYDGAIGGAIGAAVSFALVWVILAALDG